jgi:N-acetylmuramoyl-L-alanine amidase
MTGFEITLTCLALNVFKEARGEPVKAQHALALVTINRARRNNSGKDICRIVFEPNQFSWTSKDSKNGVLLKNKRPNRDSAEWKRAEQSARESLYMKDFTGGATHYHEVNYKPTWIRKMKYIGRWGNHYFYMAKDGSPR